MNKRAFCNQTKSKNFKLKQKEKYYFMLPNIINTVLFIVFKWNPLSFNMNNFSFLVANKKSKLYQSILLNNTFFTIIYIVTNIFPIPYYS